MKPIATLAVLVAQISVKTIWGSQILHGFPICTVIQELRTEEARFSCASALPGISILAFVLKVDILDPF